MSSRDSNVKNVVTFLGPKRSVRQIRRQMWKMFDGDRDLVFNPDSIIPIPKEINTMELSREFCKEKWGCSGLIFNDMEISENCISFETEEHPPRKVFARLSELYPDVSILVEFARFDNQGLDNAGQILYKEGQAKDSFVTKDFADVLLNEVKGVPFSISRSAVFDFDEKTAEKDNDETLANAALKLLEREQHKLSIVLKTMSFLTDDVSVISQSTVIKQIEKNCESLEFFANNVVSKDSAVQHLDVKEFVSSLKKNDNKGKKKTQMIERNVLTKPRYRRSKPLKKENKEPTDERH